MSDVLTALEALELAVVRADGVVDPDHLERARRTADTIHDRRGFMGETLVLALAGGTGSGKSSLLNAVAGAPVARTGVLRPCTDVPLAWIPEPAEAQLVALLDRLGISDRAGHSRQSGLALIDLPDHDSVVGSHRAIVEQMLPEVDGIVWVFDPQKYRDPLIHEGYIAPLLDYQEQFLFVLNQIDLLTHGQLEEVRRDLIRALREDGVVAPEVFALAAAPPAGAPLGIPQLVEHLAERLEVKSVVAGKLIGDIRRAGRVMRTTAGIDRGSGLGFEERWQMVRTSALETMVPEAGQDEPGGFEEVLCRLDDFVTALSVETGGSFGARLRADFSDEAIGEKLRDALTEAGLADGEGNAIPVRTGSRLLDLVRAIWFGPRVDPATSRQAAANALEAGLEDRIGAPLRDRVGRRALLAATLALVEVEGRQAEAALAARRRQRVRT